MSGFIVQIAEFTVLGHNLWKGEREGKGGRERERERKGVGLKGATEQGKVLGI